MLGKTFRILRLQDGQPVGHAGRPARQIPPAIHEVVPPAGMEGVARARKRRRPTTVIGTLYSCMATGRGLDSVISTAATGPEPAGQPEARRGESNTMV
jgi:hypothetical protein